MYKVAELIPDEMCNIDMDRTLCIGCRGVRFMGRRLRIDYPYVEGASILPGVIIYHSKPERKNAPVDHKLFLVSVEEVRKVGDLPLTIGDFYFDEGGEIKLRDRPEISVGAKQEYLYKALVGAAASGESLETAFDRFMLDNFDEHAPDVSSDHILKKWLLTWNRIGHQAEKLAFWYAAAEDATSSLRPNVLKYEIGKRPSEMLELSQQEGFKAQADRVLERNLKALEALSRIVPYGPIIGAMELLSKKDL